LPSKKLFASSFFGRAHCQSQKASEAGNLQRISTI
jgi:hypothetical protein